MSTKKIIVALLIIVVAVGGFIAGLMLLKEEQEPQKAAVPGGNAQVFIEPATGNYNVNDTIQTSVHFDTANISIVGIAVRLSYPFTGTTPEVTVSGIDINSSLLSSGDWSCPTRTASQQGSSVIIDIACANVSASGYTSNGKTLFANINLKVNRTPQDGQLTMRFSPSESIIKQKSTDQDILLIPQSTGSYTIGGAAPTATVTVTQGPTPTRGATTPTPTLKPTTTLTPTPTSTLSATLTPTPGRGGVDELPDAGVSYPTLMGLGAGILVIIGALALAF